MPASPRDRDALDLVGRRSFAGTFVTALAFDMQARRLEVSVYGTLRGDGDTFAAVLTFFGASAFGVENASGTFPESVALDAFEIGFDDASEQGSADLRGRGGWSAGWTFDGLAYSETPAVASSYRDDF